MPDMSIDLNGYIHEVMGEMFENSCKVGDLQGVMLCYRVSDLGEGLKHACVYNYVEIINYLISKIDDLGGDVVASFNKGLWGACFGGHMEIVKLMINKGAVSYVYGLVYSFTRGHLEIAKLMLKHGRSYLNKRLYDSCISCYGKHRCVDIITFILEQGRGSSINVEKFLRFACEDGDLKLAKLMIQNGASDVYRGLKLACSHGHLELCKFMVECGSINIGEGLEEACYNGDTEMVSFLLSSYDFTGDYHHYLNDGLLHLDGYLDRWKEGKLRNLERKFSTPCEDIAHLLVCKGANYFLHLSFSKHLFLYKLFCKYSKVDASKDYYYLKHLRKHPMYVLLVGSNVRLEKTSGNKCLKMLPEELLQLMFKYLY